MLDDQIYMMKIGMISRWNATCGVSVHAELLSKELVKMGYDLCVFAPTLKSAMKDWHHKLIKKFDEPWVIRCYAEPDENSAGWINYKTIIEEEPDILIIQSHIKLPVKSISKLTHKLNSKIIAVVHNTCREEVYWMLNAKIDALVVFDKRYLTEVLNEKIKRNRLVKIIPYPCPNFTPQRRIRPPSTEGKILFFSFGRQPSREYSDFIKALTALRNRYSSNLLYWIVRSNGELNVKSSWILQFKERPPLEKLLSYISGSNVHLIPKGRTEKVVVSSTVYQTIVAPTPIVTPNTRYVETIPTDNLGFGAIVKYHDIEDLKKKLIMLIEDETVKRKILAEAREFASKNSSTKVARKFVDLFKQLI